MNNKSLLGGRNGLQVWLDMAMVNRHGLISGATGTGKTVSLQVLAESFSQQGIPVFLADIKGDLSGIAKPGSAHPKISQRLDNIKMEPFSFQANPTVFWDIFAQQGHPVRTTISEMGPLLISYMLELNETQTGVIYSCFKIADDQGLLLLDLKDFRALLQWVGENTKELKADYGSISHASLGAIQRRLLVLDQQGVSHFWGEPALQIEDLCGVDFSGRGVISLLDATRLTQKSPRLYAGFLLWLLSELYETMPEVGDQNKPALVLFFDEAHLLFERSPKVLINKIKQIIRLIRSKGVGIYFISQSPLDIPEDILGQLGLKIQHALRSYTPKDKRVLRAVADTFRANPGLDTETAIQNLQTGEALVSVLNQDGRPTKVEKIFIRPPTSRIGLITEPERAEIIAHSPYRHRYDQCLDRASAYEVLKARAAQQQAIKQIHSHQTYSKRSSRQTVTETLFKSVVRSVGSQIGRQIIRGIMGSLLGRGVK